MDDTIETYISKKHSRFSTEVLLRKPTFFISNDDLVSQISPRSTWTLLGEGSYGRVYRVKWLGVDVAVKTSEELCSENPIVEDFIINSNIRHPNIVNFFVASPNFIVMELMENGTLDKHLVGNKNIKPSIQVRKKWCSQIAMAVRYLHETGIVHSDIKPENIMMDSGWNTKLCDVGGGYFVNHETTEKIYTDMYLPITLHMGDDKSKLGKSTDLYSLSVVLLCIMSWESDLYSLLGIPNFERRFAENKKSREEMIEECLETCIPNVYNLIQSYELSNDAKSFIFKIFSDPCKYHIKNKSISNVIEANDLVCENLSIESLSEM